MRFISLLFPLIFTIYAESLLAGDVLVFTDREEFESALSLLGDTLIQGFDTTEQRTLIPSGTSFGDIQFKYDIDGVSLVVSNESESTSPEFSLGAEDLGGGDLLQAGDEIQFAFPETVAFGLDLMSADGLLDEDFILEFGGEFVSFEAIASNNTLIDGASVWFLGIVLSAPCDSATLMFGKDLIGGEFLFNIDEVTTVASSSVLLGDVNLDGNVDLLDVAPFVMLVSAGQFQPEADVNQDNVVDLLDVAPFVDLLTGP